MIFIIILLQWWWICFAWTLWMIQAAQTQFFPLTFHDSRDGLLSENRFMHDLNGTNNFWSQKNSRGGGVGSQQNLSRDPAETNPSHAPLRVTLSRWRTNLYF